MKEPRRDVVGLRHVLPRGLQAFVKPDGKICERMYPPGETERHHVRCAPGSRNFRQRPKSIQRTPMGRIEDSHPHPEAGKPERIAAKYRQPCKLRVSPNFCLGKMRERFVAAIMLAEHQTKGFSFLNHGHKVRLRHRHSGDRVWERPVPGREPDDVDARLQQGTSEHRAFILMIEERRPPTRIERERATRYGRKHKRKKWRKVRGRRSTQRLQSPS